MRTRAIAMLLCLAGNATANDHPEEAAKLSLKDVGGRRALAWFAKMPPPALPAASPVAAGATLVVRTAAGETASFDLPASGWTANASGTSFKYKNALAPAGPSGVKSATVKDMRVVKVAGKAIGITLDEATQGAVSIALTIGDDVYCSSCTTALRDEPGRFAAARCPAPADCAVPTTTTSTTLPVCGNGVIESGETCDGTALGICEAPPEFMISCKPPPAPDACNCCHPTDCSFSFIPGFPAIHCCGDAACQNTRGFGMQQPGVCIPPSCTDDADCNGYRCIGGTCCGNAGQFCGVVDCCADSNATCTTATWASPAINACCRQAAAACTDFRECCSGSCVSGQCE